MTFRTMPVLVCVVVVAGGLHAQAPQMPSQDYGALFAKVNNAGHWGKDDLRGTLNNITTEARLAAVRLVRTGETVSLSRPLEAGNVPGALEPVQVAGIDMADGDIHWLAERVTVVFHGYAFSHLDAPSHAAFRGHSYNDLSDTPADRARLGIE